MEKELDYEIKISVYKDGSSRMEPLKVRFEHIRKVLIAQSDALLQAVITQNILNSLSAPKPILPTKEDIMRTKQ